MMKVLFLALLIRFVVVRWDSHFAAHAFTSVPVMLPHGTTSLEKSRFSNFHHMGDLDHDILPESDSETRDQNSEKLVVVYDDAEVALNDEAWDAAMASIMAFFVAMAIAFGGGGLFKPRPVLAVEFSDFSPSTEIVTTRLVTPWSKEA